MQLPVKQAGRRLPELPLIPKGARPGGASLEQLRTAVIVHYKNGASIRSLAERTNRSYGAINRMLHDAGIEVRSRGGARAGRRASRNQYSS
jgi:transposase